MSTSGKFVPNRAGMAKLQRDLEKQMKGMGITPNDTEARKLVQKHRGS